MAFPDGWSYYKTRNIKRSSGALSNWQARLAIAEGSSDVIGSELVTNGGFGSNTTGWATYQCSIDSVAGGQSGSCLQVTRTSGTTQHASQTVALATGKRYRLSGYIKSGTSGDEGYQIRFQLGGVWSSHYIISGTTSSEWVYVSTDFVHTETGTMYVQCSKQSETAGTMLFDEISVKEIADITLEGHAKTDLSDLRFSNSANGPLDYFIDHIDGTTPNQVAYVDVEIDSVATSDTLVKCWYGNSSATSESSGANTFVIYKDFESGADGTSIDVADEDWTIVTGTVEIDTAQKYSGSASARVACGSADASASIVLAEASGVYSIRSVFRKTNSASYVFPCTGYGGASKRVAVRIKSDETIEYVNSGGTAVDTGADCAVDSWVSLEINNIDFSAGTYDIYYNDALIKSGAEMHTYSAHQDTIRIWGSSSGGAGNDFWIDNFVVRNWRSTPPEWQGDGWSAEQLAATGINDDDAGTGVDSSTLAADIAVIVSGKGSLTMSGTKAGVGTTTVSAKGGLTLLGAVCFFVLVLVSGKGSLTLAGTKANSDLVGISAQGSLVLVGARASFGSVEISGKGSILVGGQDVSQGTVVLSGKGSVVLSGTRDSLGEFVLSGKGAITLNGIKSAWDSISLSTNGEVVVSGIADSPFSCAVSGNGSLVLEGTKAGFGETAVSGNGSIDVCGFKLGFGETLVSGGGSVSVEYIRDISEFFKLFGELRPVRFLGILKRIWYFGELQLNKSGVKWTK